VLRDLSCAAAKQFVMFSQYVVMEERIVDGHHPAAVVSVTFTDTCHLNEHADNCSQRVVHSWARERAELQEPRQWWCGESWV
jgi:hypothetical protein